MTVDIRATGDLPPAGAPGTPVGDAVGPSPTRGGLRLGNLVVDVPVVLAPMAGVTNSAFRTLCRSYGAGLYVSEMVTARALVEGNAKTLGMAQFGEGRDGPERAAVRASTRW